MKLTGLQRAVLRFIVDQDEKNEPAMSMCFGFSNDDLCEAGYTIKSEYRINGRFIYNCIRPTQEGIRLIYRPLKEELPDERN